MPSRKFVKIEEGVVSKSKFDRHVPAHLDYVRRLNEEGRRATSGYWGERGGGMMVFEADTLEEARRIVEEDPLVKEGCVTYELHEWCRTVAAGNGGQHPGLAHAALRVADVERSKDFYASAFGMRVEWRPDPDNVYLTSGRDNLALHRAGALKDPADPEATLDHLGFVVGARDDIDVFFERLMKMGAPLVNPIKDHRDGARSFYVRDPDGNCIQVIYHPPISDTFRGGETA